MGSLIDVFNEGWNESKPILLLPPMGGEYLEVLQGYAQCLYLEGYVKLSITSTCISWGAEVDLGKLEDTLGHLKEMWDKSFRSQGKVLLIYGSYKPVGSVYGLYAQGKCILVDNPEKIGSISYCKAIDESRGYYLA